MRLNAIEKQVFLVEERRIKPDFVFNKEGSIGKGQISEIGNRC